MSKTLRSVPIAIKLDEASAESSSVPEKVQLIRTGTFTHPQYGTFDISKDHLKSFKKNFEDRARGIDLAIDYSHESAKEAGGWIKTLELSDDESELWATVKWTPMAAKKLSDLEYRYLSADFSMNYVSNESLKEFGPTLLGAGLTNRPVIKEMSPVLELTEGKGNEMDPKDKQIQELQAKIAELEAALKGKDGELSDVKTKMGEFESDKKKLEEEKKLAEKKSKFDALLTEGKVVEAQREAFMSDDAMKLAELSQPVKLDTAGNPGNPDKDKKDEPVDTQIMKLAEKMVADKKAKDLAGAISLVLQENQELRNKKYGK